MRWPVATLTVADTAERIAALCRPRMTCATPAGWSPWSPAVADQPEVEVELAPTSECARAVCAHRGNGMPGAPAGQAR